ncbi:MAG: CAP domain-containing protein [Chitinophagaceae bacterium]
MRYWFVSVAFIFFLLFGTAVVAQQPVTNATQKRLQLEQMEKEVFDLVNAYRVEKGLIPLQWFAPGYNDVREHSNQMASRRVSFGHDGFEFRAENIRKSTTQHLAAIAENVAFGKLTAEAVVKGWINSKPHRKNIEGNFNFSALAIAQDVDNQLYFTQIFLKTEPKIQ